MDILLATNNQNKIKEIKRLLLPRTSLQIKCLSDVGISIDPEETGETYVENAKIKALAVYEELKKNNLAKNYLIISDDCGIEVAGLNNQPGVYSHRYIEASPNSDGCARMLKEMENLTDKTSRTARYIGGMYVINPLSDERYERFYVESECDGLITYKKKGQNGFAYDFILAPFDCNRTTEIAKMQTIGELSDKIKDKISFRGKNINMLINYINNL